MWRLAYSRIEPSHNGTMKMRQRVKQIADLLRSTEGCIRSWDVWFIDETWRFLAIVYCARAQEREQTGTLSESAMMNKYDIILDCIDLVRNPPLRLV